MSRKLVDVRCSTKGRAHLLARLYVEPDGRHRLDIPRLAVTDVQDGGLRLRNDLGGTSLHLDKDGSQAGRSASCACGYDFHLIPGQLLSAAYPPKVTTDEDGLRVIGAPAPPPKPVTLFLDPAERPRRR